MERLKPHLLQAGCTALILVVLPALAQETASGPGGQVTPEARAALGRMTTYLNGLDRFEITMQGSRRVRCVPIFQAAFGSG